LYAAGDLCRRLGLVLIFAVAHALSVIAMAVLLLAGADRGSVWSVLGQVISVHAMLVGACVLDGALAVMAFIVFALVRRWVGGAPATGEAEPLTGAERLLRGVLVGLVVLFGCAAVVYEIGPLVSVDWARTFFVELPFVTNSVVKVGGLALLCGYVARDVRRNMPAAGIVIALHVVSALAMAVFLVTADMSVPVVLFGQATRIGAVLWGAIGLDLVIGVGLLIVYLRAWNARFGSQFLQPMEYRTLLALADALVVSPDDALLPSADDVAARIDRHVAQIQARRRWVYHAALFAIYWHPVLYLQAPFPELDRARRLDHLRRHFQRDVNRRSLPDLVRQYVQIVIRIGLQLTYAGFYSDPKSNAVTGFVPFSERPRYKELPIPPKRPHPLVVERAADLGTSVIEADVCVIGSGAGGAIVAYELAKRGRSVLVVERGKYVEPRSFTEDELEMIGLLYADGVFQQTQDFRFTVLQGSCVGGSTVVNNAVCFAPPPHVLARWNDPAIGNAGLDLERLRESVTAVEHLIGVVGQGDNRYLNPSGREYLAGVRKLDLPPTQLAVAPVNANIRLDCFGCGYCNTGCAYGKKMSMLDSVLPRAQAECPGRVRIVSECEIDRLRTVSGKVNRVLDAHATLAGGEAITIRAKTFVVSAGAIAASYLLLRSGIGSGLPVGRHLCFNVGAPLTAEFDRPVRAYDGLQISHYGLPAPERGFVYETWFNPPAAQAVAMPGWFGVHRENMARYDRMMAVGVLVGSEGNARVVSALTGGPDIAYRPTVADLTKLGDGLLELGKILFAGGAKRVLLDTWGSDSFASFDELQRGLKRIVLDPSYITLGTGHPQGGNAISLDPAKGVVGPDGGVHGYSNLYVCDASVFPSSLTVNPQLTVMSLAHYMAPLIT
jgi:choline dehydrogenase-like flavoprotein